MSNEYQKVEESLFFDKEITMEKILNLAMYNPVIHAVLSARWSTTCSWEQAMMRCVYLLHHENVQMKQQLVDFVQRHGIPEERYRDRR